MKNIYMADFETTTSAYSESETKVWLFYYENIYDEFDNCIGLDIETFMYNFENMQKNTDVYFHNLNHDGDFIMHYLCDNANYIEPTDSRNGRTKLNNNDFTFMGDGVSNTYRIEYMNAYGFKITFKCSYRLLLSSVGAMLGNKKEEGKEKKKIDYDIVDLPKSISDLTDEQIEYVKLDVRIVITYLKKVFEMFNNKVGLTIASTAQNSLKKFVGSEYWDMLFTKKIKNGILIKNKYYEGEWDYFKKGYLGGFVYLLLHLAYTLIKKVYVLDINSLYPYIMSKMSMPYGSPIYNCKNKKCKHYKFIEILITADLKKGQIPFIPSGVGYETSITYLEKCERHLVYVTDDFLKIIYKWYDVKELIVIKSTCFKKIDNVFDSFFDYYQGIKKEAKLDGDKPKYDIAKVTNNSPYGKQGQSPLRKSVKLVKYDPLLHTRKDVVIYGNKNKYVKDYVYKLTSPSYIPLAIWITSLGKCMIINFGNEINNITKYCINKCIGFIYTDTDSIHFSACDVCCEKIFSLIEIHPTNLGAYDLESKEKNPITGCWEYGFYMGRKKYIEFNDLKSCERNMGLAGISAESIAKTTNLDIINGNDTTFKPYKLMKKKVKGGIILVKKYITIKDYQSISIEELEKEWLDD